MSKVFLRKQGLGLDTIRNVIAQMSERFRIARVDIRSQPIPHGSSSSVAINWGTMALPSDYYVFNKPSSIRKSSAKGSFRVQLYENGLAPYTTMSSDVPEDKFPVVVRPLTHFGGKYLAVANDESELQTVLQKREYLDGYYISSLVKKSKEFRVFVTQGRVVYIVNKIPDDANAVAWNVHQGGRFENVRFSSWDLGVAKASLKAMSLTGLDFGAVDVIVSESGEVYVLEINTAPALQSPYWVSCVAKAFDYMTNNRNHIDVDIDGGNWRNFVHPAISEEAVTSTEQVPELNFALNYVKDYTNLPRPTRGTNLETFGVDEEITYKTSATSRITFKYVLDREVVDTDTMTKTLHYKAEIIKHEKLEWVNVPVESEE